PAVLYGYHYVGGGFYCQRRITDHQCGTAPESEWQCPSVGERSCCVKVKADYHDVCSDDSGYASNGHRTWRGRRSGFSVGKGRNRWIIVFDFCRIDYITPDLQLGSG